MDMKKVNVGYIFYGGKLSQEEKLFLREAKKKNINLILFNAGKKIEDEEIEERARKCDIIFNNSAEEFAIELVKTFEELGKKVIDSSQAYYYTEDKWMFFVKCQEHGIPTPKTNLLSQNLNVLKKELEEFNCWPVILKRIEGACGDYVEKAKNYKEALRVIKKFREKGGRNLPIIAQELIKSPSYRVLVIDGKVVQTAIKRNKSWKATGVYGKKFRKFKIDEELDGIIKKLTKAMKIRVCGIDLLKKNGKWVVLEVNSAPGLDFFKGERKMLIGKILDLLRKQVI